MHANMDMDFGWDIWLDSQKQCSRDNLGTSFQDLQVMRIMEMMEWETDYYQYFRANLVIISLLKMKNLEQFKDL